MKEGMRKGTTRAGERAAIASKQVRSSLFGIQDQKTASQLALEFRTRFQEVFNVQSEYIVAKRN
jgi:hypothetical protein